jgi:hypothetical protein
MPREEMLPVLALGLARRWEQQDSSLWRRAECLPPKRKRENPHLSLPKQYKLDYEQRERVRQMALADATVRKIAVHFGVSRTAIWRIVHVEEELDD